jgi:membrane protein implicated in regulation of membrane protease activity
MDSLVSVLSQLQAWHWLALALILLVAEIATGTTHLLWPAAAAFVLAVVRLFFAMDWAPQVALFGVLTLVLTLTGRHYVKGGWLKHGANEQLNDRSAQLVGQRGITEAPFEAGVGRVKVGDTVWLARAEGALGANQLVEIVAAEGTTLTVKAAG